MNRRIGPILAVALLVLVGGGIWLSVSEKLAENQKILITGISGSEKLPFFTDPRVTEALAKHNIEVHVRKAGSRQIANHPDLNKVDFAFPSGTPAASKIKHSMKGAVAFTPFYTPMAIASWGPIADVLVNANLAQRNGNHVVLDMQKYLDSFKSQTRWQDLPGNTSFKSSKQIFVKTTDVRKSNSAAMYLSLMAYIINNEKVVTDTPKVQSLFPLIQNLFLQQGFVESSSQVPFDDYLIMGMGHSPMLFIYESQFIGAANPELGGLPNDATLIYPNPGIFSKHVFLGFSEPGKRLGELLETDDELKQLALLHGFRNDKRKEFLAHSKSLGIDVASQFINIIEPPSYEITEKIIQKIETSY